MCVMTSPVGFEGEAEGGIDMPVPGEERTGGRDFVSYAKTPATESRKTE